LKSGAVAPTAGAAAGAADIVAPAWDCARAGEETRNSATTSAVAKSERPSGFCMMDSGSWLRARDNLDQPTNLAAGSRGDRADST
jgi:hypothetical protein